MKFSLKSTSSAARLGVLTNVLRLPDFELETPNALLYTKSGTIPHLTYDVLQLVTKQNMGLHIPVSHVTNIQNRLKLNKCDIAKFIGMNEYLTYCTFINPAEKRQEGFHEKNKVSLWTRFGRKTFTAEEYMELMEDLKPDLFLVLADGDTHSQSSSKRSIKSFNNTATFFKECTEFYKTSNVLKDCQMMAAIEGGFNLKLREECSELVGSSSAFGVVLDGFHDCSDKTMEMDFHDIKNVLAASLKHIPSNKLRIIHGCWNPSVVLDLVEHGIDLFDSSYPYLMTEQGCALIFPTDIPFPHQQNGVNMVNLKEERNDSSLLSEMKCPQKTEYDCPKRIKVNPNSKYYFSLNDTSYSCDFSPVLTNCKCYTCQHHTKAYIHHLLNVKEMLGCTLLMIHNLHHYLQFMAAIRKSLSTGVFKMFKNNFQGWAKEEET